MKIIFESDGRISNVRFELAPRQHTPGGPDDQPPGWLIELVVKLLVELALWSFSGC